MRRFVTIRDQLPHHATAVLLATKHEQQHPVRHVEARYERLRRRDHQLLECLRVPTHLALRRAAFGDFLFLRRITRRLLLGAFIFDDVFRRLHHDVTHRIEAAPARAPGHLTKVAHAEDRRLFPVVFPELRKHHRANRHVDADAERVRATDQFEQPVLRELLHEDAILRQQSRVVHADAVAQPTLHFFAIRAREPHAFQHLRDGGLFFLRAHVEAHQTLRRLRRRALREMHEVDRRAFVLQRRRKPLRQRRLRIFEFQRHRAPVALHRHRGHSRDAREFLFEKLRRAERRRHEQKPRARHQQQRRLPRVTALGVRVIVKLVHDHRLDRVGALAAREREVGQNLCSATQHRRVGIHARVARHHADVLWPKLAAQRKEFFVHQRLDRARIDRPLARAQRLETEGRGDKRLARAGRRIQNHITSGE